MTDVFNRVAMLVDSDPTAQLQLVRDDRIILKVASARAGAELIQVMMMSARLQGFLSLGRDNKTWYVTIPQ